MAITYFKEHSMNTMDYTVENATAAAYTPGVTYDDWLFGVVTLGYKDEEATERAHDDGDFVDMYRVHHSGYTHIWSASVVVAAFRHADTSITDSKD